MRSAFKSKVRGIIGFSATSIYWTSEDLDKRYFIEIITFLIENRYFTIGNMVFKQDIGITKGIDPAPFWENLFLYLF